MATREKLRTPPREVYARLPEGTLAQLIDGEIVMSLAPTPLHQHILGAIFMRMANFLEEHRIGKVFLSPIDLKLTEDEIYQPDIIFLSNDNLHKIKSWGIDGAPNLVVEVLCPATAIFDRNHKIHSYKRSGVQEYLVVDPAERRAELWRNETRFSTNLGSSFSAQEIVQQPGKIELSQMPGFTLSLSGIFES